MPPLPHSVHRHCLCTHSQVHLQCGENPHIAKVEEPEICKYHMVFQCPQACVKE